jgi:nitrate/TMAO reductase-like tetraheme cytochrome c subunit
MKLPDSVHNWLSYTGVAIAALALSAIIFLFVVHSISGGAEAPYAGLIIFMLLPAVLLGGVVLIPIGMYREWRHRQRTGARSIEQFPIVDLNKPQYRNALIIFVVGSLGLLFGSSFVSYQAYEYTESVAFCGTLCHSVMEPEHTAYRHSPHARVRCVDCHVGPGASFFVKSKIEGLYQVYAVLLNKFPRPIAAPISNLRPARETCEQCHWPEHFFEAQERRRIHFLPDEANTRWEIRLLIKTGGGSPMLPQTGGIHWHMNIENQVEYIATDHARQQIPWVRMTDRLTGQVTVFNTAENALSPDEVAQATVRTMDCMDCHNRPTHIYQAPRTSVNFAMAAGLIDPTLPSIKKTAVELLAADYASKDDALAAITNGLRQFYAEHHPEVAARRADTITEAIQEVRGIYERNFFPTMKVRWDAYPDNIGHSTSIGCFRCHDGLHTSASGRTINNACTSCHIITAQGPPDKLAYTSDPRGLEFEHPGEIGDAWKAMQCTDCHSGALP